MLNSFLLVIHIFVVCEENKRVEIMTQNPQTQQEAIMSKQILAEAFCRILNGV